VRALGDVVARRREALGLTQHRVARRIAVTATHWCRFERCTQKDIGLVTFTRVAAALGLAASELMREVEEEILREGYVTMRRDSAGRG
jgi:transcriptional regulator with XRE-family HTH domain